MRAEDEVLAVSAAWDRSLLTNDARRIEGFMTDDWVYVGPDGPSTRSEIVGWIAAGRLVHDAMSVEGSPRVLRCGDTVVLTARKASAGRWDGVPYTADEWISEVYVHRDGSWRCSFSQKTPVSS